MLANVRGEVLVVQSPTLSTCRRCALCSKIPCGWSREKSLCSAVRPWPDECGWRYWRYAGL